MSKSAKEHRRNNAASAANKTGNKCNAAVSNPTSRNIRPAKAWVLPIAVLAGVAVVIAVIATRNKPSANKSVSLGATHSNEFPTTAGINPVSQQASGTNGGASLQQPPDGAGTESETERAIGLMSVGDQLMSQGKLKEAIDKYRQSLSLSPGDEDAHYNLAIALARDGQIDEAISHYKESLKLLPDYAEAHNNLGNLLVKKGNVDEAIEHFGEALRLNPDSASAHNNLGKAFANAGKINEAALHFAKAIQIMPNYVDAHCNLGNAYVAQARTTEAIGEFKEALKSQPNYQRALAALARIEQQKRLESK